VLFRSRTLWAIEREANIQREMVERERLWGAAPADVEAWLADIAEAEAVAVAALAPTIWPEPAPVPVREQSPAERRASIEAASVPQNGALEWCHAPAEPAPVPDVGRGRPARTVRRPLSPREIPDHSAAR
jgi:hypothetical protein